MKTTCAYCGKYGVVEVEHVEPISRGGTDTPDNRVWACFPCNRSKGNQPLLEWVFKAPRRKRPKGWIDREVARLVWEEPGIRISEVARRVGVRPYYIIGPYRFSPRRPSSEREAPDE